MPLGKHYSGHGNEVMASMKATYAGKKSADEVRRIFYATENARKKHSVRKAMKKS